MGVFPLLLSASIGSASITHSPLLPLPDPVRPALWKVSDGDTTVYLFGTFHALDGSANWFKDGVKLAFQASDQLMLETLVPTAAGGMIALPRTRVPVRTAPATSFAASTQMVMNASRRRGMTVSQGADAALRLAAEGSGKPVGALESFEFQINMFSALGRAARRPVTLHTDASAMVTLSALLAKLQDAWVRGDTATFEPMLEQMRAQSPTDYRTMFADRNARWAGWIAGRLQEPGTVFVAVGAGHLAGRDSVQNQLAAIGVGSVRVN